MTPKRGFIIGGCLLFFAAVAYVVAMSEIPGIDALLIQKVYAVRNDALTPVMKVITYMGNWQSITLICAALLFFKATRRRFGYITATAAILASLLNKSIKHIFHRARPDIDWHLIEQGGFSFTSGHSITSVVVYGLLIYFVRTCGWGRSKKNVVTGLLCAPLIFVGISRVYLGVHYPTDVMGGWALGIAVLTAVVCFLERKKG